MARLMVLGLLKMKPMSGYEIQQILEMSQTDLWAGILPGSIYHALKKMEKEGLIEIDSIEQTGNRSKAIYKIVDKGEEEFITLAKQTLTDSSVLLPSKLYTAIGFLNELSPDEIIETLRKQKDGLNKQLERQRAGEQAKKAHTEIDEITRLTFENIYLQYELQIDYIDKLLSIYTKGR
ncbi:PadR family transcriptional regulator [Bacillus spongiae]|uniref:PadR family transcriptional regulator n=1 Tax=Bacillus spongiae TaxID=2683610 RepID=A0ABU8HFE2_9BACI